MNGGIESSPAGAKIRIGTADAVRHAGRIAVALACVNVAAVALAGSYDLGIPGLSAHGLFKPLQWLNAAVLVSVLLRQEGGKAAVARAPFRSAAWFALAATAVVAGLYWPALGVNFATWDWTHRHISSGITSVRALLDLFTKPQPDGFYRPLGFVSLWADYALFGVHYRAYHLQGMLLHAISALLAFRCFKALGFSEWCSQWAALLLCAAAVCAEPLVWPAARFDLLSTAFILAALLCAVSYLRGNRSAPGLASFGAAYCLALMSKETAYALPVLLVILPAFGTVRMSGRFARLAFMTAVLTAAAVGVRVAIYGNLGGYGWTGGPSPHFGLGLKTLWPALTRTLLVPQLALNNAVPMPAWMTAGVLAFAAAAALSSRRARCESRARGLAIIALVLASALPVAGIVGWIGPEAAGTRYAYLPAVWTFLFVAWAAEAALSPVAVVALVLIANAAGTVHNAAAYRHTLAQADLFAARVRDALVAEPSACRVELIQLPGAINGVIFFGDEVEQRIRARLPRPDIRLDINKPAPETPFCAAVRFQWDSARRDFSALPGQPGRQP